MYLSTSQIQSILNASGFDVNVKKIKQLDAGFDKKKFASAYIVEYFKGTGSTLDDIFCFYYEPNGIVRASLRK